MMLYPYHENRKVLYVLICNNIQFILCKKGGGTYIKIDIIYYHFLKEGAKYRCVFKCTFTHNTSGRWDSKLKSLVTCSEENWMAKTE